ncbi:mechanosensitive ion channel domain-containing protein [Roseofilum casamattae]|uniref:Mechanosensitive ion channel n=1 Tax=Roseofilum casamattae BLCC-M143 TaxID=3022442 RepID=A0ABT7BZZ8_9CYAN|nr:mechanosensitive ion channel domain-containing protein [Roseofilum casamattae]MDJ1184781.1 mechanosensitive ion channel [Roseofilum casamattae BLCC-M143]
MIIVRNRKFRWQRWIAIALLAFSLTAIAIPSWGRSPLAPTQAQATVQIDGRNLFAIGGLADFPAPERAEAINQTLDNVLRKYLNSKRVRPQYSLETDVEQVAVSIDGNYVLTVTLRDGGGTITPEDQARRYAQLMVQAMEQAKTERQLSYLRRASLIALCTMALVFTLQLAIARLTQWGEYRLMSKMTPGQHALAIGRFQLSQATTHRLITSCRLLLFVALWYGAAYYATNLFPFLRRWRYWSFSLVIRSFTGPIFSLNQNSYSLLDVLFLIGLTIGLWTGVRNFTVFFRQRILAVTRTDRAVQDAIGTIVQSLLMFLGVLIILQVWGLDVGSLTIIGSVLGVGIGFGLQNIANNLISGLIMMFERHVQVGDFVEVADLMGTVENVGARSTQILTLDGVSIIVPNSRFLETEAINWSHGNPVSQLHVPVGVAYSCDPQEVRSILLNVADAHPEVLVEPPPNVMFKGFGDSSLNFELLVWLSEPRRQFRLRSDLYFALEKALRDREVEIPFPQQDVHLRSSHWDDLLEKFESLGINDRGQEPKEPEEIIPEDRFIPPSNKELHEVLEGMRSPEGVEIKDRWYRGNLYPNTFVAAEAVDWWMLRRQIDAKAAVRFGQWLCDRHIIYPVSQDMPFADSYQFYRFYENEAESGMGGNDR